MNLGLMIITISLISIFEFQNLDTEIIATKKCPIIESTETEDVNLQEELFAILPGTLISSKVNDLFTLRAGVEKNQNKISIFERLLLPWKIPKATKEKSLL